MCCTYRIEMVLYDKMITHKHIQNTIRKCTFLSDLAECLSPFPFLRMDTAMLKGGQQVAALKNSLSMVVENWDVSSEKGSHSEKSFG